jgi:hypothetical protein
MEQPSTIDHKAVKTRESGSDLLEVSPSSWSFFSMRRQESFRWLAVQLNLTECSRTRIFGMIACSTSSRD